MYTATNITSGSKSVTTAGTAEALGSNIRILKLIITANKSNTGAIYIGDSSVSSSNSAYIYSGGTLVLDVDNLSKVYIDADTSGEGVQFTYLS